MPVDYLFAPCIIRFFDIKVKSLINQPIEKWHDWEDSGCL
jgi:hypothetical protein